MIYINTCELNAHCMDWASQLPRFAAICGIPRAGTVIASLLAQYQNNHLISVNDLLGGKQSWKEPLRRNCPAATTDTILVVDDTVATGERMNKTREQLKHLPYDFRFAAYLVVDPNSVDYFYRTDPASQHLFQLNIFHHWFDSSIMTDLDGVLSEDWTHDYETGDLEQVYFNHLENARCLMRPTFPMHTICTGRLEKFRPQTMAWLAKHGIEYRNLIMFPASRPEDRRDVGIWKGQIYRNSNAGLFVESCPHQSRQIRDTSGRQTLDWSKQLLI